MRRRIEIGSIIGPPVGDPDLLDEALIEPYLAELRKPFGYRRVVAFTVNAAPAKGPRGE